MITEDYCSDEVAKLLREKGFNEPVTELNRLLFKEGKKPVLKITLQKAMKWLREIHNIVIVIDVCRETGREGFYCWQLEDNHTGDSIVNIVGECSTYEQACEASILYCLKNLI